MTMVIKQYDLSLLKREGRVRQFLHLAGVGLGQNVQFVT